MGSLIATNLLWLHILQRGQRKSGGGFYLIDLAWLMVLHHQISVNLSRLQYNTNMELVGCAASVSQLLVYLSSSATSLQRLYTELIHCNSTYCDEAINIRLLLHTIQRLGQQQVNDNDDHSPVLPVLISISGIACQVLHLLKPKRIFGIDWAPVTSQDKISSAFETLDKKRNLLQLYISQEHQEALLDLRQTVESSCKNIRVEIPIAGSNRKSTSHSAEDTTGASMDPHPNQPAGQPTKRLRIKMTGAKIEGYNSMFNGHKEGDIEGELGDLTFGSTAGNFVGNASDETERMFLQSSRRNQGCSHPDYAYMPARAPPSQGNHAREAKPRFHDISSDRFISSRDSSSYQGADYRAEVREPSWHGTHHAQHLERNFTSQQYGAQQVQGPERDTASPWYSNRQIETSRPQSG
ncbi:hypothetical protein COCCADRAFT_25671 [Bipolaris zeicola 26-R-13]|uniref:Uncharacterized protein n=1 Tax=Cochliobolus carbonum (strain 26-R-13) TaxID=930089 RepID=W6Y8D5_COCC2|nr:uncharacterized protein COCCADRAFT_25671 [Bipolaris zeicola 26-R-13]EUC34188.1 hypothetical protein COCCADRAFT_25671 [Bipolaris zeicola 26-R-13]